MNCKCCGKPITGKAYPGDLCQSCYKYFREGGTVHPLPAPGVIAHDDEGKVICHCCGRSYRRLGSHVRESHGMTIAQYKATYGLCARSCTTQASYHETMRGHALDNHMDRQLLDVGKDTRIKAGETDKRQGKEVRLQERIEKRERYAK